MGKGATRAARYWAVHTKSACLAAMKPEQGRVKAPKIAYTEPRIEKVVLPSGKIVKRVFGGGVRAKLHQIISRHAGFKVSEPGQPAKAASYRTQEDSHQVLGRLFDVVLECYPIEDPARFDGRHLQFLYDWMEGLWRNGQAGIEPSLSSATIAHYVSDLRRFCAWIGQPELAERAGVGFEAEGVTSRQLAATHDKSWEGQGVDIEAKIMEAAAIEPWVAVALLCQHAFGVRRKEALRLRPKTDWDDARRVLRLTKGTKGGRPREVELLEDWQYELLAEIWQWLHQQGRPNGYIADHTRDLRANLRRYDYVMQRIGLTRELAGATGHGLRAGFFCRFLSLLGVEAPVWGGNPALLPPEVKKEGYSRGAESGGHSRHGILCAYVGSIRKPPAGACAVKAQAVDVQKILGQASVRQQSIDGQRRGRRGGGRLSAKDAQKILALKKKEP